MTDNTSDKAPVEATTTPTTTTTTTQAATTVDDVPQTIADRKSTVVVPDTTETKQAEEVQVTQPSAAVVSDAVTEASKNNALANATSSGSSGAETSEAEVGDAEGKDAEEDLTNLIINYLPPTMSEGTLATLFSPYGLLERCKIVVDLQTLRSRGYGFVKYDSVASASRAMQALNGYELNGKKLKVAYARKQCKAITNANLYITNVPPHYNDDALFELFKEYGVIVECRILRDKNGQSRGVGFVRMDTHHNAIQALQAMDQHIIDDKHAPLLVKLATRRIPRRYWNNGQNRGGGMNQGMGGGGMNQGGGMGMNQGGGGMGPKRNQNFGGGGGGGGRGGGGPQRRDNTNRGPMKKNFAKKYYSPKTGGNFQQGGGGGGMMDGMGGAPMNSNVGGGAQGMGMNKSPPKRGGGGGGGYYRAKNNAGGGGGGKGAQQYGNNPQRRNGPPNQGGGGGGPPYFPAPMYDTHHPYGAQMATGYGAPATYANIPMPTAGLNNPNAVGPGRY
eukprot:CAMPEP_0202693988 /NCGR_PEP_ID=MMETSP1385-20130828/7965_1 /ASSEMBLY_ACC=CAM_ASM_000861 /TAXON_ID=933848 /ORGANISM="Elphidium margaritaceum" /LENGTH=502 /DNA_ID=CAMNT_0049349757 /DNA_START=260 /DNA_END=1768 /DNA_ORIENTATION=-